MLGHYVKKGMTVADVGCGMGYFSIGMAKILKGDGKVISVDLQKEMLDVLEKRARREGVFDMIQPHLSKKEDIGLTEPLDFVLTFWMIHEIPAKREFLQQIQAILKDSGLLLIAEPKFHVSRSQFGEAKEITQSVGFRIKDEPKIAFSHSVVFTKV